MSTTTEKVETTAPADAGKKKKMIMIIAVVAILALGGGYFMFFGPSGGADAETSAHGAADSRHPGEVVRVDPLSVNLADAHYLRVGFSMQLSTDAGGGHGPFVTAKAVDVAIELFTGRTMEYINDAEHRAELKEELLHLLDEAYHGVVMEVYFTDFVTQ